MNKKEIKRREEKEENNKKKRPKNYKKRKNREKFGRMVAPVLFPSLPSPAGMSLIKLSHGRNNSVMTSLFPPRESFVETSRLGTGNSRTVYIILPQNIAGRISEAAMGGAGAGDLIFHSLCSLHVVQWKEKCL
jgi:hypothetical protein